MHELICVFLHFLSVCVWKQQGSGAQGMTACLRRSETQTPLIWSRRLLPPSCHCASGIPLSSPPHPTPPPHCSLWRQLPRKLKDVFKQRQEKREEHRQGMGEEMEWVKGRVMERFEVTNCFQWKNFLSYCCKNKSLPLLIQEIVHTVLVKWMTPLIFRFI